MASRRAVTQADVAHLSRRGGSDRVIIVFSSTFSRDTVWAVRIVSMGENWRLTWLTLPLDCALGCNHPCGQCLHPQKKRRLDRYVAASAHMLLTLMRQLNSVESWSVSDRHAPGDNASSGETHY